MRVSAVLLLLCAVLLTACSGQATKAPEAKPQTPATYSDPFAYCAAVGTIDAPDSRYTGEAVPQQIAVGLRKAFGLPDTASTEPFLRGTFWRCMDGAVYACSVGANLPCQEKANLSQSPTEAMNQYCQQNPASDFIPMVVTGRATVYNWRCNQGKAEVGKQVTQADARGFLANVWHKMNN
jgi:hypothetical protein